MNRSALTDVLWRTLGGVFGVAVLISVAFVLNRFVGGSGLSL
ncbi:MAG: hypothetical protein ACK4X1_13800 [Terricaulis sp.]